MLSLTWCVWYELVFKWYHIYLVSYFHHDVIKWKHFPRCWPFVRGIHRSPVNSPHKGQWRGVWMFSLICVWIKGWVNNRKAGDLRRYRAHYDIIVMLIVEHIDPVTFTGTVLLAPYLYNLGQCSILKWPLLDLRKICSDMNRMVGDENSSSTDGHQETCLISNEIFHRFLEALHLTNCVQLSQNKHNIERRIIKQDPRNRWMSTHYAILRC